MATAITQYTVFWFQRPLSQRCDREYRKRYRWFVYSRVLVVFIGQSYVFTASIFEKVPSAYQPILALVLPILRYGSGKILHKITTNARGENELSSQFAVNCKVTCNHALYLAIIVGSTATNLTAISICVIDAVINLRSCFTIIKLHRRHEDQMSYKFKSKLQALVMKETLELLLPITYCVILSIAYFGPNAENLGNIKNDYWQYKKIEDIRVPLSKIGLFLLVDVLRIALNFFLLWKYCKINLRFEYCQMMETYWKAITAYVATYLLAVSYLKLLLELK